MLDAGNGAASAYAGEFFERLGARVTLLHAAPDGRNVNERCGSTSPAEMAARVVAEGAGSRRRLRRRRRPLHPGRREGGGARRRRHPLSLGDLPPPQRKAASAEDRGHLDEQSGPGAGARGRGDRHRPLQRGGPLRGGGYAKGEDPPGRRAVRPHRAEPSRQHRRRPADGRPDGVSAPPGRPAALRDAGPTSGAIRRCC